MPIVEVHEPMRRPNDSYSGMLSTGYVTEQVLLCPAPRHNCGFKYQCYAIRDFSDTSGVEVIDRE